MSEQVTGKVKVRIDGGVIESENEATLDPGGVSREPASHGGKTYYTESDSPPSLKFKILLTATVDVTEVNKWKNKTATFITDTGQRLLMRNAFTVNVIEHGMTSADVEMSGDRVEKV